MSDRPNTEPGRPAGRRRRGVGGWVDPRDLRLGGYAFVLNRITGLGLVFYLYLHLFVLSTLARGAEAWDDYIAFALNPAILVLDVLLLAGLLIHGLNGIRVALLGFGLVLDRQRALFVALMIVAAIVLLIATLRIYEVA